MQAQAFKGKVALITGSSRGIGLATARELAGRGARVVLNARSRDRLEQAQENLAKEGMEVMAIPADVSDPDACRNMISRVVDAHGRLDILINNAGISMRTNLEELDHETCKQMVDVNLMGCIYPTLYAIEQIKRNQGSLVFISSIAALLGLPTASLYCATKRALTGLAGSLRCELGQHGVHVGVVYVGFTENHPEKQVVGAGGSRISPDRPAHMTWQEVAREVAGLIQKRKRQATLSPVGKLARAIAWLSPGLVEKTIILFRKHQLSERLGIR